MDFRNEVGSWTIQDVFGVCFECDAPDNGYPRQSHHRSPQLAAAQKVPGSGPQMHVCWNLTLAWTPQASTEALRGERHQTPSPSIACIDPRLTVLWSSPPASPSEEESSEDGDWTAFDDWPRDSAHARVSEAATFPLDDIETGSTRPNAQRTKSLPSRECRKTRTTATEMTQVTTRAAAAARNAKAIVKGQDKAHTKWKCRTRGGDIAPSGPSARISQVGRFPDPRPMYKGEESCEAEGIEKIHMKLWKCRIGGCNKTFHRKGDAVRHLQTTARHNGKAVVCSCGAPFSRHDALKRHQRLCNGHVS